MPKSICIKLNNIESINYILNELEQLKIDNVYFSCKKFKNYMNFIIHYKGKAVTFFISSISKILTYLILDLYENKFLIDLIASDYFYFSYEEQQEIFNICMETLNYDNSLNRLEIIKNSFFTYLSKNKSLNLKGFINFRLYEYKKYLNEIIDLCVNKYIIDKEYLEFVNLLRAYVESSPEKCNTVHLIYKHKESILLDSNKNIIPINKGAFDSPFLSDISFSSNDYTLNSLLSLLPKRIYVHLIDEKDEFINTLELIFDSRFHICTNCDICALYKNTSIVKL